MHVSNAGSSNRQHTAVIRSIKASSKGSPLAPDALSSIPGVPSAGMLPKTRQHPFQKVQGLSVPAADQHACSLC